MSYICLDAVIYCCCTTTLFGVSICLLLYYHCCLWCVNLSTMILYYRYHCHQCIKFVYCYSVPPLSLVHQFVYYCTIDTTDFSASSCLLLYYHCIWGITVCLNWFEDPRCYEVVNAPEQVPSRSCRSINTYHIILFYFASRAEAFYEGSF